jgi:hypothetical protein
MFGSKAASSLAAVMSSVLDESGSCLTARPPKGLLWNVLFRFVLGGVLSWQLMKHYPKWHQVVWVLGTLEGV